MENKKGGMPKLSLIIMRRGSYESVRMYEDFQKVISGKAEIQREEGHGRRRGSLQKDRLVKGQEGNCDGIYVLLQNINTEQPLQEVPERADQDKADHLLL